MCAFAVLKSLEYRLSHLLLFGTNRFLHADVDNFWCYLLFLAAIGGDTISAQVVHLTKPHELCPAPFLRVHTLWFRSIKTVCKLLSILSLLLYSFHTSKSPFPGALGSGHLRMAMK